MIPVLSQALNCSSTAAGHRSEGPQNAMPLPSRARHRPMYSSHTSQESSMNNPVIVITGALTGIGRATALAFAKDGARLVVSGRKEAEGKELVAELRDLGSEAEFVHADVRHED